MGVGRGFFHSWKNEKPPELRNCPGASGYGCVLVFARPDCAGTGGFGESGWLYGAGDMWEAPKKPPRKVSHGGEDRTRQRGTGRGGSMRTREGRGRGGTGSPHPLANPRRPWEGLLRRNSPHAGMQMRCTCKKSPGSALNQGSPFLSEPEQLADNGTARQ